MSIMRHPRVADVIAGTLRQRILNGTIEDGDLLPRQEDLLTQFDAGLPAIREALRILELEGLISVRRGNSGGASVHLPTLNQTAYMTSLVLQSRNARLKAVGDALTELEPLCAKMCAERNDRAVNVVPKLYEAVVALRASFDGDPAIFNERSHDFHRGLVEYCGNEAMRAAVGSLVVIWAAHERAYTERARRDGTFPGAEGRQRSCEAHERILVTIREGNGGHAFRRSAVHLSAGKEHHFQADGTEFVTAATVQDFYLTSYESTRRGEAMYTKID